MTRWPLSCIALVCSYTTSRDTTHPQGVPPHGTGARFLPPQERRGAPTRSAPTPDRGEVPASAGTTRGAHEKCPYTGQGRGSCLRRNDEGAPTRDAPTRDRGEVPASAGTTKGTHEGCPHTGQGRGSCHRRNDEGHPQGCPYIRRLQRGVRRRRCSAGPLPSGRRRARGRRRGAGRARVGSRPGR